MDKYTLAGILGYYFTDLISKTVKQQIYIDKDYDPEKTYLYAFWHNKIYFPMINMKKNSGKIANLVSPSKDGKIIATMLEKHGYLLVRGSSNKNSVKSLVQMIKLLREGVSGGFAVDGPRGPIYEPKQGIIYAAQKSGVEIVPLGAYINKKWILDRSWDKLQIPKPFSKAGYVIGKPFKVEKDSEIEKYSEYLKNELFKVDEKAKEIINE